MSTIEQEKLTPYAGFALHRWTDELSKLDSSARLEKALDSVETALNRGTTWTLAGRSAIGGGAPSGVTSLAVHVTTQPIPAWAGTAIIVNTEHHLITLMDHAGVLGVAASDPMLRVFCETAITGAALAVGIDALTLEETLLNDRVLRTLWLKGTHRKSVHKAASKVLSGLQLQTALSPLDDRTFMSSAARSAALDGADPGARRVVGVSPDKAYVWISPTDTYDQFLSLFEDLVDHILDPKQRKKRPVRILAKPLLTLPKLKKVSGAFDFAFIDVETASFAAAEHVDHIDLWSRALEIQTVPSATPSPSFELEILDAWQKNADDPAGLWRVKVAVTFKGSSLSILVSVPSTSMPWGREQAFRSAMRARSLWSVWYETGQTLINGKLVQSMPTVGTFDGAVGIDFKTGGWDITTEKPLKPAMPGKRNQSIDFTRIGATGDQSLCSWWLKQGFALAFPALTVLAKDEFVLMVCDDGAGEVGDFLLFVRHKSFELASNRSHLAVVQVHLKAAGKLPAGPTPSGAPRQREMAPKKYEEVLQQATKNLANFDFPRVAKDVLSSLKKGQKPAWLWKGAGKAFVPAFAFPGKLAAGGDVEKHLGLFDGVRHHQMTLVVQPHVALPLLESAMNAGTPTFRTRLLCTMLCATQGACQSAGVTFRLLLPDSV